MFLSLIMFLNTSTSYSNESNVISTIAGNLEIKRVDYIENWIILNDTIIKKIEDPHVYVEHKYDLKKSNILIISTDAGGSGTLPSYFIIELFKNKNHIITEYMYSVDRTFNHSINSERVTVDLGFESGLKKYGIYENEKLKIKKVKVKKTSANEDDCNYLYNKIYIAFVESGKCDQEPYEVGGMATARPVYAMENDPRLNIKPLRKMSENACRSMNPIRYTKFRKIICNTQ